MLQEPLLVVGAFYIMFFTVIIYVRLDFSITKVKLVSRCIACPVLLPSPRLMGRRRLSSVPQDPAAEVRMKVASITEQVLTLVNKRLGLYRHLDEAVNRYKQSRDTGALNSARKAMETEHRSLTTDVGALQGRLKAEGSDLAEKVGLELELFTFFCVWISGFYAAFYCNLFMQLGYW